MKGVVIHPPLFTKVMGRPKKNRKKAPEEKIKRGVAVLTKAGVTMHCSVCGKPDHNKKGHNKYVERQLQEQRENIVHEDEEVDIPYILEVNFLLMCFIFSFDAIIFPYVALIYNIYVQHVIPHTPNPSMDPTHSVESMVYKMGQEVTNYF
jgi:hypothetical protein